MVSGDVPLLDVTTLNELIAEHRATRAAATLLSAILDDPTGYGRIVRDADGSVDRIVEQKDATDDELRIGEINSGTYVFAVAALRTELPRIGSENAQGERYLTDVVGLLRADAQPVAAVATASWLIAGINDRVQLAEAAAASQRDDRSRLAAQRRHHPRSGAPPGSTSRRRSPKTSNCCPARTSPARRLSPAERRSVPRRRSSTARSGRMRSCRAPTQPSR